MTYFNTNNLNRTQLRIARSKNEDQQSVIKDIFLKLPRKGFTPFEILDNWPRGKGMRKPLITSVRRAINLLTAKGVLEKLEETKMEREGAPNHLWKLSEKGPVAQSSKGQFQLNY